MCVYCTVVRTECMRSEERRVGKECVIRHAFSTDNSTVHTHICVMTKRLKEIQEAPLVYHALHLIIDIVTTASFITR